MNNYFCSDDHFKSLNVFQMSELLRLKFCKISALSTSFVFKISVDVCFFYWLALHGAKLFLQVLMLAM